MKGSPMASANKTVLDQMITDVRKIHRRYYNTTHYIAVIVTVILILQIWWMTGGYR